MVTTRKLLFIIFILVLIIITCSSICFADTLDNNSISVDSSNLNVQSIDTYTSGSLDNYKSVFSRYSSPIYNIRINDVDLHLYIVYRCNSYESASYEAFKYYFRNVYNFAYIVNTYGNVSNNLSFNTTFIDSSPYAYVMDLRITGALYSSCALNNPLLIHDISYNYNNVSKVGFAYNAFISRFSYNGFDFTINYVNSYQYTYKVTYIFDPLITNLDGVVLETHSQVVAVGNALMNFDLFTNNSYKINNQIISGDMGYFYDIKMLPGSSLKSVNLYCYNNNSSILQYFNSSSDYNVQVNLIFYPPVLYNDLTDYIESSSNENTDTPLKLNYYDCEWYEIHLQLANAFIFMITELPIVSDVTNVIFVIINLIKNSLDVLLQFNSFGILFAFGMFAVVLGLLIRLFMGGE